MKLVEYTEIDMNFNEVREFLEGLETGTVVAYGKEGDTGVREFLEGLETFIYRKVKKMREKVREFLEGLETREIWRSVSRTYQVREFLEGLETRSGE